MRLVFLILVVRFFLLLLLLMAAEARAQAQMFVPEAVPLHKTMEPPFCVPPLLVACATAECVHKTDEYTQAYARIETDDRADKGPDDWCTAAHKGATV